MAKKSFKDNPALQFISTAGQEEAKQAEKTSPAKAPEGYKPNPLYIEKKTKRVQLVLQPSLFDRVKATADAKKLSVNEFVHQLLEEATREE